MRQESPLTVRDDARLSGPPQLLVADDELLVRSLLIRLLHSRGYACTGVGSAAEALELLAARPFDLLLCDVHMPPGKSGLDVISTARQRYPDLATIMVTAEDDQALAEIAIRTGTYGYVLKPFQANQLIIAVANALHRRKLEIENRMYRERLEQTVVERTGSLRAALSRLQSAEQALRAANEETLNRLMRAAEFRDNETAQHIQRMSRYCELLARLAGQDEASCQIVRNASAMHDIGKIGTPDNILLKPGKLDSAEFTIMREHAEIGYRILQGSGVPALELGATIAYTHHEKFDGSGYPRGLRGETIPIEGRITAICDVFDALLSRRVYKHPHAIKESVEFMGAQSGAHFDPVLLGLFLKNLDGALDIKSQFPDD